MKTPSKMRRMPRRAAAVRIKSKERRASALAELVVALAAKGDKKSAGQLLEEARGLVDSRPDNEREVEALLEVARGYALVDPVKTFEMLDPLIDQANDMMSAAALLEKFGAGPGLFRKGEMILAHGLGEVNGTYARYVKALAELSRVDFERTRAAAEPSLLARRRAVFLNSQYWLLLIATLYDFYKILHDLSIFSRTSVLITISVKNRSRCDRKG